MAGSTVVCQHSSLSLRFGISKVTLLYTDSPTFNKEQMIRAEDLISLFISTSCFVLERCYFLSLPPLVFRSLVPSRVALLVILLVLVFILNRVGRCVPEQELREAAKMNDGVGSTQNLKCISSLNQFVLSVASIKRSQYNTMERYIAIVLFCHVVIDPSDHSDPLCIDRQLAAFFCF
jgi:hypothetical protein